MTDLRTARRAYVANADYAATNDLAKARAFETACRQLIVLLPSSVSQTGPIGNATAFSVEQVAAQLQGVESFIASHADNDTGPASNILPDFSDYRG